MCSHRREWSNCIQADAERSQCGYDGITESECIDRWDCCYDRGAMIQCFLPLGSPSSNHKGNSDSSTGMSNAGAVMLTMFFFILPPAGYLVYSKFITRDTGGFSNPVQ